jgi:hypothetical protein
MPISGEKEKRVCGSYGMRPLDGKGTRHHLYPQKYGKKRYTIPESIVMPQEEDRA